MKKQLLERYYRLIKSIERFILRLRLAYARLDALRERKRFVQQAGRSVINRKIRRSIRAYARRRFGSAAYWPYLALYTEIRGRFVEGWVPFDYLVYVLEPKWNPPVYRELGNQDSFDYKRFGDSVIKPVFFSVAGLFYDPEFELLDEAQLGQLLLDYNDNLVIKQDYGSGEKQIRFLHSSEFRPDLLEPGKKYVIQPYIKQYKLLNDLYPDSVNTFRVATFLKKDATVDILYVILRFGVDGSKVDSLESGGQCIHFDMKGRPANVAYDKNGCVCWDRHKNTGYRFADLEFPMFQEILDLCKTAHQNYPFVRLVGWDVCVDEAGVPRFVEWTTDRPTFDMEEALFGPFFPDNSEF